MVPVLMSSLQEHSRDNTHGNTGLPVLHSQNCVPTSENLYLHPEERERNLKIHEALLRKYKRPTLGCWFKLNTRAIDIIVQEFDVNDEGAWRESVEAVAECEFARPEAPESYKLVSSSIKKLNNTLDDR